MAVCATAVSPDLQVLVGLTCKAATYYDAFLALFHLKKIINNKLQFITVI